MNIKQQMLSFALLSAATICSRFDIDKITCQQNLAGSFSALPKDFAKAAQTAEEQLDALGDGSADAYFYHPEQVVQKFDKNGKLLTDKNGQAIVDVISGYEEPMLLAAIRTGNCYLVQALINHGANVNAVHEPHCLSALGLAVTFNNHIIVEMLLKAGAQPSIRTQDLYQPLCLSKSAIITALLINYGADIHARDPKMNCTPFECAIHMKAPQVVDMLITAGLQLSMGDVRFAEQNNYPYHQKRFNVIKQDVKVARDAESWRMLSILG